MSIISQRIHERRVTLGLTLLQIADSLGVKEATVQRYESGAIKNIGHDTVIALSAILKCSPSYLLGVEDTPPITHEEQKLLDFYNQLNKDGKSKLFERAQELISLGYVQKGDVQKMA